MTDLERLKKATALLRKAKKDIETAEELLAVNEGWTDCFGNVDALIDENLDFLNEIEENL